MVMKSITSKRKPGSLYQSNLSRHQDYQQALFGATKSQKPSETQRVIKQVRQGKNNLPQVGILHHTDIERMRALSQQKSKKETERDIPKMKAQKRKHKERIADADRRKKEQPVFNQLQLEKKNIQKEINQRAVKLNDQQMDLVKRMNSMVKSAKAATVRQRQLDAKKQAYQAYKEEQKKKDLVMEVQRLKAIQKQNEKQQIKKSQLKKGKQVIIQQIKQRDIARILAQQQQQKQKAQVKARIKKAQQQQEKIKQAKIARLNKTNEQIIKANQIAFLAKKLREQQQKKQQQKIIQYIKAKDQLQAQNQAQIKRKRQMKEKQLQLLRQKQEKATDRRAQLDAIRAKRAFQSKQRQLRVKQKMEAQKRKKVSQQLKQGRKKQQEQKQKVMTLLAKQQQMMHRNKIEQIKHDLQVQKSKQNQYKKKVKTNQVQLKKQMAIDQQKKAAQKALLLEGGKIAVDKINQQTRLLQKIKKQKLQQMKTLGIPDKYQADLARLVVK